MKTRGIPLQELGRILGPERSLVVFNVATDRSSYTSLICDEKGEDDQRVCDWRVQTCAGSVMSRILHSKSFGSGYRSCLTSSLGLDGSCTRLLRGHCHLAKYERTESSYGQYAHDAP